MKNFGRMVENSCKTSLGKVEIDAPLEFSRGFNTKFKGKVKNMNKDEAIKMVEIAIKSASLRIEDVQHLFSDSVKAITPDEVVETKSIFDLNIELIEENKTSKLYHEKDDDFYFLVFDGKPSWKRRALLKKKSFRWNPQFGFWYHSRAREDKCVRITGELESMLLD